ncbi:putative Zinc finger protein [Fasciola gigantica]|uniref:Bromodomain adjacent to zinc finger domain protein 1A n=1 Tax=Fasciola gigantica TaxID=46835 RepID=A0A504YLX0_FASGI|nr:putative Zinc finger protein [Fasciola gigantica]
MPLLGGRLHVSNPTWKRKRIREDEDQTSDTNEKPPFMVNETQEICTSEQELRRKNTVYAGNIWTCRVTGRPNLTYKQACCSEASANRILRKHFSKCFEKPVLERVHLSTLPLEMLVHSCWTVLHEQFHVDEPVRLKVDSVSNTPIHGVIHEIDTSQVDKDNVVTPNNNSTTSPNSSDKENTVSKKNTPVKKNYTYTVKISSDVPLVVSDIPTCSIKTPTKDHVRMFIRAHAMRYGPNFSGPWIVDNDMLRRYKILAKNQGIEVDRIKLKQMSSAMEEEYEARLLNNQRQNNASTNPEDFVSPAPIFKKIKRFSVLREGNNESKEDNLPLSAFKGQPKTPRKSLSDDSVTKKMKQATLFQFGRDSSKDICAPVPRSPKEASAPALPRVAQHLIKMYSENHESPAIATQITVCAKVLSDSDLAKLPKELRDRVLLRKEAIAYRKKLLSMTPQQRKALIHERKLKIRAERQSANLLVDDLQLVKTMGVSDTLPEPTTLSLPAEITDCLFGRLLGLCEFFHCFQNLLVEGLEDGEPENSNENNAQSHTFPLSPLDSSVPLPGESGYSDDEDKIDTDAEEEEAGLIVATAPLPEASSRALRRLGLRRLTKAVATDSASAGAYRSLTRPLALLMRLLLRDEDLGKKRELGIRLKKIPVTPYTAPELLRLTLLHGTLEMESRTHKHVSDAVSASSVSDIELIDQLTTMDVYQSCPDIRLRMLETAVERLFDLDLIDDHILACHRRATEAWNKKNKLLKDRNIRKKEQKDEARKESHHDASTPGDTKSETPSGREPNSAGQENGDICDDLASVVKRRRVLAARAAAEREERENLERERRAALAQEYAQERALSTVLRMHDMRSAEARCALRCHPIGYDRYYRRIWYFRCAPDCLFVESNWAAPHIHYSDASISDKQSHVSGEIFRPRSPSTESVLPSPAHMTDGLDNPTVHQAWSSWRVYNRPEQLDELAAALLDRGIRESSLKRQLFADGFLDAIKTKWRKFLSNCSGIEDAKVVTNNSENDIHEATTNALLRDRNEDNSRTNSHGSKGAEAALAGALLKNLLDTEVRLRSGGLGGVPDFTQWQEKLAMVNSSFGLQADNPLLKRLSVSSCDSDSIQTPDRQGLIDALIEVAENIMPRFLSVPDLAPSRKEQQRTDTENQEEQSEHDTDDGESDSSSNSSVDLVLKDPDLHALRTRTWLARWRTEVRNAHTLTRLNLLHACLDASIRWEKSVEDARCRICRHKSDDDNLLLCDGCNKAFHLYCLRPPLRRVPAGDWFCPSCRPASKDLERRRREARLARSQRRRRRRADASSEEDGDSESSQSVQDTVDVAESEKQTMRTHVDKRSKSESRSSLSSVQTSAIPGTKKQGIRHDLTCLLCGCDSGDMVHCSHCPNTFHLSCHNPPLHHLPRGDGWICASCRHIGRRAASTVQRSTRESRRIIYQRYCQQDYNADDSEEEPVAPRLRSSRSSSRRIVTVHSSSDTESESAGDESVDLSDDHESLVDARPTRPRRRASSPMSRSAKRRRRNFSTDESLSEEEDTPVKRQTENARCVCSRLINTIIKHRHSWPFRKPVDKDEVPDYYEIIANPVDLSMIRDWLSQGRYDTDTLDAGLCKLVQDLGTMFYNAELYNAADSDVWIAGNQLEQFVRSQVAQLKTGVSYHRQALDEA